MRSDELDKILDNALASYPREEPRPGVESRVLNRIRASRQERRFAWLRWAVTIPAFACLLLLALTFWSKRDSTPKRSNPAPIIAKAAPLAPIAPAGVQMSVSRPRLKRLPVPKPEQFPTPTPLTDEERALLAFVARSPKQAEEVFADAKNRSAGPIEIKEIQIEPLQDGGHE